jgi:hypothetical protein
VGPTRMGYVRFEWGLKLNIESLHHPEETLNPVQLHLYILQAERVAQLTQRPSPKNPEAMTTEARQGWKHTE